MTTYTKSIIEKNQRYILKCFDGKQNFYHDINVKLRDHHGNVYRTVYAMFSEYGIGAVYYTNMVEYLAKTIPKFDRSKYLYKNGDLKTDLVERTYCGMMARDGTKLYEKIAKEHPDW